MKILIISTPKGLSSFFKKYTEIIGKPAPEMQNGAQNAIK